MAAFAWNLQLAAVLWGFTPALVGEAPGGPLSLPWWVTPWTAELLHGGWFHLGMNMLALWIVGRQIEPLIGASGLIFAYFVGAAAAAAAQYVAGPAMDVPMVGASGAISTLFGIQGLLFGRPTNLFRSPLANRILFLGWLLGFWVVLNLALAFLAGTGGMMLATPAHIGGFVAGLALAIPLLRRRYRPA
ncbi:rhomboid family intramembrane serine protease [Sphingomonas jaspsi]|uniref:rhomboid family intramembrane serine protease n=1 Tax=Sphingomonas jaspsi TaxID=392409 RepID=UPI000686B39E|nr:rhomboid family intramembrane serine protease [Sphingomonas jaspsi]